MRKGATHPLKSKRELRGNCNEAACTFFSQVPLGCEF